MKKSYTTNVPSYSRLISLLQKRDRIVHTKPKPLNITTNIKEPPNYGAIFEQTEFIYTNIDEGMRSLEILKDTLRHLEGCENDLILEISNMLNETLQNILQNTLTMFES
ncbi:hypothetical protein SDC9_195515 [bioreactor metagenome]|uniref:Uncharacterized protein n=1 Tax=bioreactor metagenome TaxID=1076179 RepID=A0A645I9A5_9ZZZZ